MKSLYAGYADQAELDKAYDVENSVPDFGMYAQKFTVESEAARAALHCRLNVPYGPTLMENVDIFMPKTGGGKAPILVFIHGGYWKSLTASVFSVMAIGPVEAGMCVVNVTYALCPEVEIGEIVRQVRAAVAWTARNAETFGGDPDRIIVSGHSAGGHLTATTMLTDWGLYGLPANLVKGGFAISGLFDLEPLSYSFMQPALRLTGETILRHSPLHNVVSNPIPLAIAWGDADPEAFSGQSKRFAAAWSAAGNRYGIFEIANANHFQVLDGFKTADGLMTRTVLDLLMDKLPPLTELR
jgi:arylformamidase